MSCCSLQSSSRSRSLLVPVEIAKVQSAAENNLEDERLAGTGEVAAWSRRERCAFVENKICFICYKRGGKTFKDLYKYRFALPATVEPFNTIFARIEAETADEVYATYRSSE